MEIAKDEQEQSLALKVLANKFTIPSCMDPM